MGDGLVSGIIVVFGCLLLLFGGGCAYLVVSESQGWASILQAVLLLGVAGLGLGLIAMVIRTPSK
jgi:hypothetical protein